MKGPDKTTGSEMYLRYTIKREGLYRLCLPRDWPLTDDAVLERNPNNLCYCPVCPLRYVHRGINTKEPEEKKNFSFLPPGLYVRTMALTDLGLFDITPVSLGTAPLDAHKCAASTFTT